MSRKLILGTLCLYGAFSGLVQAQMEMEQMDENQDTMVSMDEYMRHTENLFLMHDRNKDSRLDNGEHDRMLEDLVSREGDLRGRITTGDSESLEGSLSTDSAGDAVPWSIETNPADASVSDVPVDPPEPLLLDESDEIETLE
jgi:hypothetical protein